MLPPGDVLKCALALARNEGEARRVLLSRLPTLEHHARLGGHTGGNLLLSMMEQYSGDFLAAVDGLRGAARLQRQGLARSASSPRRSAPNTATAPSRAGKSKWTRARAAATRCGVCGSSREPTIHPAVADAVRQFDAVIIGPGSFFTSILPPLLVRGVRDALADMRGPIILISNLLTEGRGMAGFTAAEAARWVSDAIGRPVDVVIANTGRPSPDGLMRYAGEHKEPLETRRVRSRRPTSSRDGSGAPRSRATIAGACRLRSGAC